MDDDSQRHVSWRGIGRVQRILLWTSAAWTTANGLYLSVYWSVGGEPVAGHPLAESPMRSVVVVTAFLLGPSVLAGTPLIHAKLWGRGWRWTAVACAAGLGTWGVMSAIAGGGVFVLSAALLVMSGSIPQRSGRTRAPADSRPSD